MEGIIVRAATMDDIPVLLTFEQGVISAERPFDDTLKPDPLHYYDLTEMVRSNSIALMVAELDGNLVGSGYARIEKAKHFFRQTHHAYLGFMYTLPDYRGKGINDAIIKALQAWGIENGIHDFELEVYCDNLPAIRAYEKAGFKKNLLQMTLHVESSA